MLAENRHRFNEMIIAMTDAPGFSYEAFVREVLFPHHVIFTKPTTPPGHDWRDAAIKSCLVHSYNAPHVWFTEQDFEPLPGFWDFIDANADAPVIAAYQGERMHPCSIFMARETLKSIKLDFAANPPAYDHFGAVQLALARAGIKVVHIPEHLYYHHNGLSHNWSLISANQPAVYKPELFSAYLRACLASLVVKHGHWAKTAQNGIVLAPGQ